MAVVTSAGPPRFPHRDQRRLRRRARPGHRPGDVPGGQHDLHRPRRVRPVEQQVRRDVPAAGDHGDRRLAARRRPGPPPRIQARLPRRVDGQPRLDGPARRQHTVHRRPRPRVRTAARGHGLASASGFGLTVPTLNTFTATFHPDAVDRSVLVLNALLGLGTALAPIFVAIFVGLGFWWGLPVLSAILLAGLIVASRPLPLHTGSRDARRPRRGHRSRAGSRCTPPSPCSTASARR